MALRRRALYTRWRRNFPEQAPDGASRCPRATGITTRSRTPSETIRPWRAAADPRSWTAETVGAPAGWTHPLPDALIAPLRSIAEAPGRGDGPITALRLTADEQAALGGYLAAAKHDLEQGRGFVVLDRLPVGRIPEREAIAVYWMIGQLLGEPIVQNVQGTLLYDVRDSGQDVASGARFSVTNYESSFHTDNSFGETVVDYVGLLCLKTARSGGVSQVVSGLAVVEALRREDPGRSRRSAGPSTLTAGGASGSGRRRRSSGRRSSSEGPRRSSVTCATGSRPGTRRPASP